jgi:hypothetical protein
LHAHRLTGIVQTVALHVPQTQRRDARILRADPMLIENEAFDPHSPPRDITNTRWLDCRQSACQGFERLF